MLLDIHEHDLYPMAHSHDHAEWLSLGARRPLPRSVQGCELWFSIAIFRCKRRVDAEQGGGAAYLQPVWRDICFADSAKAPFQLQTFLLHCVGVGVIYCRTDSEGGC